MNRLPVLFCSLILALAASACSSGSDGSGIAAGADGESAAPATALADNRGTIYLSTIDGDLLTIDPDREAAGVLWQTNDGEQLPVFEVAPANGSSDLYVVFNDPDRSVFTSLQTIAGGSLRTIENDPLGHLVVCLDNHTAATTAVAHQLLLDDGSNGSAFAPIDFDASGNLITTPPTRMDRNSVVCPRWSSDRAINITSAPVIDDDFTTVAMHVDSADANHSIAIDNCNLHASSISPDDASIVVNATCYGERWADSGLYLLAMADLSSSVQLTDMRLLASGVFGRSAFHPDGTAIAAARTAAVADQTIATDFNEATMVLAVIDLQTNNMQELTLPNDAKPHSIAWLASSVHG